MREIFEMKNTIASGELSILIKTYAGLEEILAQEVRELGGGDATTITRGVTCTGDWGFVYKLNLGLRTGLRVLVEIKSFAFKDNKQFYDELFQINWTDFFEVKKTFRIDSFLNSEMFNNSMFVSQLAKDAIVDRFRKNLGERPFVDSRMADVFINLYIRDNHATVYLDTSGESLHKRGYRQEQVKAPLSEVMAAGIILLSGWSHHFPLIDPMCGSGTFSIEAALIANKIPPGIFRKGFSFENLKIFDKDLFDTILNSLTSRIQNNSISIKASDRSNRAVSLAKANAEIAGVFEDIDFKVADFSNTAVQDKKTFVFMNPPYGERMNEDDLEALYGMIGSTLKHKFSGSEAWLFTSNLEGIKFVGLRHSKKLKLFNGPLECYLLKYELYQGSRKIKDPS